MRQRAPCVICSSSGSLRFSVPSPRDPDRQYSVFDCLGCGLGFIYPRPTPAELEPYYREYHTRERGASEAHATTGIGRLERRLRNRLAWAIDFSNFMLPDVFRVMKQSQGSVCDIGCGAGVLLEKIHNTGIACEGVEPSPDAIEQARARGLTIHQGTAEQIPSSVSRSHSLVTMTHVLEHTIDPNVAISNCSKLLRTGGSLLIEVPNNACISAISSGPVWRWLDIPRHVNFFNRQSLEHLLKRHGFRVRSFRYTGFCRVFSDEWIADERTHFDGLTQISPQTVAGYSRNSRARAWLLLMRCLAATKDRKYDSIGVEAVRA